MKSSLSLSEDEKQRKSQGGIVCPRPSMTVREHATPQRAGRSSLPSVNLGGEGTSEGSPANVGSKRHLHRYLCRKFCSRSLATLIVYYLSRFA